MIDPLVFEPYFRPQVWGGRGLESFLSKPLPPAGAFGESWELSPHPLHVSRVAEGPLAGKPLVELWAEYCSELTGQTAPPSAFPLLIKYLDCHELLSVQVHPDDRLAAELVGDRRGKTEAWVVLRAEPTARIYAGLRPGVDREELLRRLDEGTVAEALHSFVPAAGDVVFLPAGVVHAVGGGVLMAEVQQASDATFRLFDWNRLGADGRPRALHRQESLRSIDWNAGPVDPVAPRSLPSPPGVVVEGLVDSPYFILERFRGAAPLAAYQGCLSIFLVIEGTAELSCRAGDYRRRFSRGATALIPASAEQPVWTPIGKSATLLGIRLGREAR